MLQLKYLKFYIATLLMGAYIIMPDWFLEHYVAVGLFLFFGSVIDITLGFSKRIFPLDLMAFYGIAIYCTATGLFYYLNEIEWYIGFSKMAVDKDMYFRVAFPGTLALIMGLYFPFPHVHDNHHDIYKKVVEYLEEHTKAGVYLYWFGVGSHILAVFVGGALTFVLDLGSQLMYIGGLYIWFSPTLKNKWVYIAGMFMFPVVRSLQGAMFGELVFWTLFLAMFMSLKYKVPFYRKLIMATVALAMMFFIQSIKQEFRLMTWYGDSSRNKTMSYKLNLFQTLWQARVDNPEMVFGPMMLSSALERTNQGMLVSMAIRYVPDNEPFCNGETIFLASLGSFIPRFLWPDKPKAGGRPKMIRFTGFDPGEVTAMDIGQLGDAYVNFGIRGGAIFMFVYGLIFSFILSRMFSMGIGGAVSLIIWIPLFYVGVVKMEGSVLDTFNHIVKSMMFAYMVFFSFDKFFDIKL